MHHTRRHRQRGAVIITVCLLTLFLLGFIGIALDFGRLFIVKSELQTAMDSCALSAAQELDLQPTAIERATSAGLTAGNLNAVNLQSADWSGKGQLVAGDLTFRDFSYAVTSNPATAQYVECQHLQPAVQLWLLQAMGAFTGDTTTFSNTKNVMARAVATRAHGQTTCPLPVAMKPKTGGVAPDYGYTLGEWVPMITDQSEFTGGHIGWMSLVDGENGTNDIRNQLKGFCGTKIDDQLEPSDSGSKVALVPVWNWRFGLYAGAPDFTQNSEMRPDLTGYAYTLANSSGSNVYSDFASRRSSNEACAASVAACKSLHGFSLPGNINYIAPSGDGPGSHGGAGTNRRLVLVPVVDGGDKVDGFACMLMLQPLSIPMAPIQLEYRGNASDPLSPCSFSGIPGGAAGPLVPALVR
jgi:hypothetical protein